MKRMFTLTLLPALWISIAGAVIAADESPIVFHVDAEGRGEYSSIQAAINAAPANAVVRIGPGRFRGPVKISRPLTLEGAGSDRTFLTLDWVTFKDVLIDGKGVPPESQAQFQKLRKVAVEEEHGEGPVTMEIWQRFGPKPALTVKDSSDVIVRGMSISMPGPVQTGGWQMFPMVQFDNAQATVEGCAFVGSAVEGIEISGKSKITIQKCLVGGIRAIGITVNAVTESRIQIIECDVRSCGYAGIAIKGAGDVTVSRCRISRTDFHGIRYDDASPTITGNVFFEINRAGIYVDGKTKGRITENLFLDCGTGGAEDVIANNTFVRKAGPSAAWIYFTAISTGRLAEPVIRNNVISGFDYALVLHSSEKQPLHGDSQKFEGNVCDTTKSAIVNIHSFEPKKLKEPPPKPEIKDLLLPEGNWNLPVKFTDPEHGDYSLSQQVQWPNDNLGARKHVTPTSPWPEQPAERAMLDQIKEVESQER